MKWAISTVIAVLAAIMVLPTVASAHEADIDGSPSCRDFFDGSWHINWTVTTTASGEAHLVDLDVDVVDGDVAPNLGFGDFSGFDGSGDEQGAATTSYSGSDTPSNPLHAAGIATWSDGFVGGGPDDGNDEAADAFYSPNIATPEGCPDPCDNPTGEGQADPRCVVPLCVDGQHVTVPQASETDTGDCDPIRVCVDGQNFLVTEHEQAEKDLDTGDCPGYETPRTPPPTPPTVTTPPVQQVAAAVSQVLPAALPSTGMGPDESSSSFSWGAAVAVALLSLGGLTALMARRQES